MSIFQGVFVSTHSSQHLPGEASVGTYREFVVFDAAQIYPEYVILYEREFWNQNWEFLCWSLHIWKGLETKEFFNQETLWGEKLTLRWIIVGCIFLKTKPRTSSSGERETRAFKSRWRVAQTGWFEDFRFNDGFFRFFVRKLLDGCCYYDTTAQRNGKKLGLPKPGPRCWTDG